MFDIKFYECHEHNTIYAVYIVQYGYIAYVHTVSLCALCTYVDMYDAISLMYVHTYVVWDFTCKNLE